MGFASMIDWTFNIGTLVQIVVLGVGGLAFLFAMKGELGVLNTKISSVETNITGINTEIKELRKVVSTLADHDTRITRCEDDIREVRTDIKELRHGEGFVLPLKR